MTSETELREEVAQHKQDVLDTLLLVIDFQASMQAELRPDMSSHGKRLVSGLFTSCFGIFRGVYTLLADDMTHEAMMLNRTLVHDSTVLAYFHRHQDRLEELALSYVNDSLIEQRGLEAEAASIGFDRPDRVERVEEQIDQVRQMAASMEITKIRRLPQLKDMLRELNVPHLYWAYKEASQAVHSNVLVIGSRLVAAGEDFAEERPYDATATYKLGRNAAEAFITANVALGHLLQLGTVTKWAETREKVRSIMDGIKERNAVTSSKATASGLQDPRG